MTGRDLLFEDNPYKGFIEFCKRQVAGVTQFRGGSDNPKQPDALLVPAKMADANLVCSNMKEGDLHLPMFDIDMPAMLLRSSTRNHYHLYIDKPMTWDNYVRLLDVMAEVGILEPGYVAAAKRRRCAQLRTPWTKKARKEGSE